VQGLTGESPTGLLTIATDGGVFSPQQGVAFGAITDIGVFCGSTGGVRLNQPIVGVAEHQTGGATGS